MHVFHGFLDGDMSLPLEEGDEVKKAASKKVAVCRPTLTTSTARSQNATHLVSYLQFASSAGQPSRGSL